MHRLRVKKEIQGRKARMDRIFREIAAKRVKELLRLHNTTDPVAAVFEDDEDAVAVLSLRSLNPSVLQRLRGSTGWSTERGKGGKQVQRLKEEVRVLQMTVGEQGERHQQELAAMREQLQVCVREGT